MAIELTADASYGFQGKQHIARITGRHPRFTFEREFIGRKGGKRGDITSAMVDEPGLYVKRNAGRKGVNDTFLVVLPQGTSLADDLDSVVVTESEAMTIARDLENGEDVTTTVIAAAIRAFRKANESDQTEDQEELVSVPTKSARRLGLDDETKHPRWLVVERRSALIARLEAVLSPPAPVPPSMDLSGVDTEALISELTKRGITVAR